MGRRVFLKISIPLLLLINVCCQVSNNQSITEKLIGRWKAADLTLFRGKELEFSPDRQVTLILENGEKQSGQYEITGNVITFSIGDAPPFKMNFSIKNEDLYLAFPDSGNESKYVKLNH